MATFLKVFWLLKRSVASKVMEPVKASYLIQFAEVGKKALMCGFSLATVVVDVVLCFVVVL